MKSVLEVWGQKPDNSSRNRSSSGTPGVSEARNPSSSISPGTCQTDAHQDEASNSQLSPTPQLPSTNKKKREGALVDASDKNERGLRQFSLKVCKLVESKGRTTYNEVAYELVAEFLNSTENFSSPDQKQNEEKNIRRRVYDALNVLMAMDIIYKDKREIQWRGLPGTSLNDFEDLKAECIQRRSAIEKKETYLRELQQEYTGLQNLVERNKHLYNMGNTPGVNVPFILIQIHPHATVEVEISVDMQRLHFDLNSTPFKLHNHTDVLKAMGFCETHHDESQEEEVHSPEIGSEVSRTLGFSPRQPMMAARSNIMCKLPDSPPIPGILKPRSKNQF